MSASNNYFQTNSNTLPPKSQTRSSSVRVRPSRSSTTDRMLHRTLTSRSPSSSSIVRRGREPLSQQNNQLRKTTSTSSIKKTLHSFTNLSSINNSQSNFNPDYASQDVIDIADTTDTGDYDEIGTQNQSDKENITSSNYPFEIDKNPVLKQRTASGKKLAQEVLEMYEELHNGAFQCMLCKNKDKVKIIKQTGRGTANLRSHLLVHGLKNFAFDSQDVQRSSRMNPAAIDRASSSRKREIDEAILKCTIDAGLPFNLFNHDAVVELLRLLEPGYIPPDRHTISSRIHDQYYQHIFDLKSLLPNIGPIAFTSDLWKDVSRQHIISLSFHSFSVDFEFVSSPLSFHLFQEQKLAINIRAFFEYERERFGLNSSFLSGITTDNGPDIKCASSSGVLGPRFACLAHCLNLVVFHGVCLWNLPNPKRFPFDSMYEPVKTSLVDDEDDEITSEISLNELSSSMADQQRLLDYNTQQLIGGFDFDETNTDNPTEEPVTNRDIFDLLIRIYRLILKVRDFVSMARTIASLQRYITERTDSGKGGFVLDVKVRWNSSFKMINRLISLRDLVDEILNKRDFNGLNATQKQKLRSLIFTHDDWDLLNALHDCLEPFEKITTILSGDYPTQSMSYYALQILKASVEETSDQSHYHKVINKSLSYQYDYYLDAFLPFDQKITMKASDFMKIFFLEIIFC
ncbi:unnamed protein product [Adineta steineri]|uniref:BED-type domain-containing protein n=1 Tax=Adineta steineri TaxID=433720 RepID=A0A815MB17_9BILA|nr:unnamed protein product [Adineta steineri]CAF1619018.1 unnamed protein product [Adineta steineri]